MDLVEGIKSVVVEAEKLHTKYCSENNLPVNYVCIFSHSDGEFSDLVGQAEEMGVVVQETTMGPVYLLDEPFRVGDKVIKILKVRKPDENRSEMGDADFTVSNYDEFKTKHLENKGWNLIERPGMEMLELVDPGFNALAYYSHPTLAETLGIKL